MRDRIRTLAAVALATCLGAWVVVSSKAEPPESPSASKPYMTALFDDLRRFYHAGEFDPYRDHVLHRGRYAPRTILISPEEALQAGLHRSLSAIPAALDTLARIDPERLTACDASDYHVIRQSLRRDAVGFQSTPPKIVAFGARKERPSDLPTLTETLTGQPITPVELLEIADQEYAIVSRELARLEDELIDTGLATSLDGFAARPEFQTRSRDVIQDAYEAFRSPLPNLIADQFHDYNIGLAQLRLSTREHRWRAVGSYDPRRQHVTLYLGTSATDLKSIGFLAVHEEWPGHHFERVALKTGSLCAGSSRSSVNTEAWATYAETLAKRAGAFDDPAYRLGWLDYRMVRIGRLYLDARQLRDGLTKAELQTVWEETLPTRLHPLFGREYFRVFEANPDYRHHHVSYIIGRRMIERMRRKAERELGDRFSVQNFHHALLTAWPEHLADPYPVIRELSRSDIPAFVPKTASS